MARDLKLLHPKLRQLAENLIEKAAEAGLSIMVTQTLRTVEEQNELYAQGRTKPGRIVTNARGGESFHNYGLAFDIVLMNGRKPNWDTGADINDNDIDDYFEIGELGERLGLTWGGRWKFKDLPHFQFTFGLTLKELQSGKSPSDK